MLSEKDLLKLQNGSDIRGVAVEGVANENVNLTAEAVNLIASGFVKFLSDKLGKKDLKIAIGHDSRITADKLKIAAIKSLVANGAKVLDCGLSSTPAMFMSIIFADTKVDGAIMLTASHLPFNRNGMKFFTADGGLEKSDITKILKNAANFSEIDADISTVEKFDLIGLYSAHLCKIIRDKLNLGDKPLSGM